MSEQQQKQQYSGSIIPIKGNRFRAEVVKSDDNLSKKKVFEADNIVDAATWLDAEIAGLAAGTIEWE